MLTPPAAPSLLTNRCWSMQRSTTMRHSCSRQVRGPFGGWWSGWVGSIGSGRVAGDSGSGQPAAGGRTVVSGSSQPACSLPCPADDDAFINVPHMVTQLRALCENPGCVGERLYLGRMAKHSEVLLQPGHKWNNAAFHNHTGGWVGGRVGLGEGGCK